MFNRGPWLSMRAIIRYPQREIEKLIIRSALLSRRYVGNGCCCSLSRVTRATQGRGLRKTTALISQLRDYLLLWPFVTVTCRGYARPRSHGDDIDVGRWTTTSERWQNIEILKQVLLRCEGFREITNILLLLLSTSLTHTHTHTQYLTYIVYTELRNKTGSWHLHWMHTKKKKQRTHATAAAEPGKNM